MKKDLYTNNCNFKNMDSLCLIEWGEDAILFLDCFF